MQNEARVQIITISITENNEVKRSINEWNAKLENRKYLRSTYESAEGPREVFKNSLRIA